MKVTNSQLFLAACNMMSRMIQPSESAAYTDSALVKRAVKIAKMVADEIPEGEKIPDDVNVISVVDAAMKVFDGRPCVRTQLTNVIRLLGYEQIQAEYMISRAETLKVIVANVKGSRTDYTLA